MKMVTVNSQAIRAVGYDARSRRLKILFTQGHDYDFCEVPPQLYEQLMTAPSKGRFYNDNIKDRYPC